MVPPPFIVSERQLLGESLSAVFFTKMRTFIPTSSIGIHGSMAERYFLILGL